MNDQDREGFEAWWDAQPEGLGFPASRADACITWLAALAYARKQQAELVEAVEWLAKDAVVSTDLMFVEEVDIATWNVVQSLAAQLKEQHESKDNGG